MNGEIFGKEEKLRDEEEVRSRDLRGRGVSQTKEALSSAAAAAVDGRLLLLLVRTLPVAAAVVANIRLFIAASVVVAVIFAFEVPTPKSSIKDIIDEEILST